MPTASADHHELTAFRIRRRTAGTGDAGDRIRRYLAHERAAGWPRPLAQGAEWCELLDEFTSGPELADVQTRACWMGGYWSVIGTKLLGVRRHAPRWGLLLARTDPAATGYDGLTCFICDMTAPGVAVAKARATPRAGVDTVLLDRVELPRDYCLGEVGDGWRVLQAIGRDGGGGPSRLPGGA
ncbi:hypothetical protein [Nocardia mikamii]|uniref:hypothetical protein n=1 Tax=Nocardia mikamii TaxID=508464 RepID=UPI0007A5082C|nr:hypothetical protein [Nocardia mikamii]